MTPPAENRGRGGPSKKPFKRAACSGQRPFQSEPELHAIVCSRLGRDLRQRSETFAFLRVAVQQARFAGRVLLVADGTAAAPWVRRAAQLFDVPTVELTDLSRRKPASQPVDSELIERADRVSAIWVRKKGLIADALRSRLRKRHDDSTWVAVCADPNSDAADLIQSGAIGWYRPHVPSAEAASEKSGNHCTETETQNSQSSPPADWSEYLVHCTRAQTGQIAGQSKQQFQDELILGGVAAKPISPFDALLSILSSGWLYAGARLSCQRFPVVCWSAVPLPQLLKRRTYRSAVGRWDYQPYGFAIHRRVCRRLGVQPVVYGLPKERVHLPNDQHWRFQALGNGVNWQEEREWRCRGSFDLQQISPQEGFAFVPHAWQRDPIREISRWPVHVIDGCPHTDKSVQ